MSVIRWEDPPPHGNNKSGDDSLWAPVAATLRERPGAWAVIAEVSSGTAGAQVNRIKTGWGPFAPRGSFESRCRKVDGTFITAVYARYVGTTEDGAL